MTLPVTSSRIAFPSSGELGWKGIRLGEFGSMRCSCSALEEPRLTILAYFELSAVGQSEQKIRRVMSGPTRVPTQSC